MRRTLLNATKPSTCPCITFMPLTRAYRLLPSMTKATCCGIGPVLSTARKARLMWSKVWSRSQHTEDRKDIGHGNARVAGWSSLRTADVACTPPSQPESSHPEYLFITSPF